MSIDDYIHAVNVTLNGEIAFPVKVDNLPPSVAARRNPYFSKLISCNDDWIFRDILKRNSSVAAKAGAVVGLSCIQTPENSREIIALFEKDLEERLCLPSEEMALRQESWTRSGRIFLSYVLENASSELTAIPLPYSAADPAETEQEYCIRMALFARSVRAWCSGHNIPLPPLSPALGTLVSTATGQVERGVTH